VSGWQRGDHDRFALASTISGGSRLPAVMPLIIANKPAISAIISVVSVNNNSSLSSLVLLLKRRRERAGSKTSTVTWACPHSCPGSVIG
jgi:hypothetical protein